MYSFFLDGERLPVTPDKMDLKVTNQNKTVALINSNEINFLKYPGLSEISFDIALPQVRYPYAVYPNGFRPAEYYTDLLKRLKLSCAPFQFQVTRTTPAGESLFSTDLWVSLEEYKLQEDAKNGMDVTASVKLREYRAYQAKILDVQQDTQTGAWVAAAQSPRTTVGRAICTSLTIAAGDTLYNIAKRYLGDGERYTEIMKRNGITDPNNLVVGQTISLPE